MSDDDFRIEHDSMGDVRVPASANWAAQTQRAVENFPISTRPINRGPSADWPSSRPRRPRSTHGLKDVPHVDKVSPLRFAKVRSRWPMAVGTPSSRSMCSRPVQARLRT